VFVIRFPCADLCSVNTYSDSGLEPCMPCPVGFYQPSNGSVQCLPCTFDVASTDAQSSYCPGKHWILVTQKLEHRVFFYHFTKYWLVNWLTLYQVLTDFGDCTL